MASQQPEDLSVKDIPGPPEDTSHNSTDNSTDNNKNTEPEKSIRFWCSECGQKYRLPQKLAGKTGICFRCESYMFIPRKSQDKPPLKLTVVFPCKHCGKKIRKKSKLVGSEIKCSECGSKNIVPSESKISVLGGKSHTTQDRILFWCNYCGQKYRLPKKLAGKTGNCDRCRNDFVIPEKSQEKPQLKETVVFPCKFCGQKQWRETSSIGEKLPCVKCGEKLEVPENFDQTSLLKPEITEPQRILFWCAHCGQKYRLPKKLAGKKATCDRCHNDFIIPNESQNQPSPDDILTFPCDNCGQKVRKSRTLAGKKFTCRECGGQGVVPLKSKKSLIEIVSPKKILKPFVSTDTTNKKHPNANDEVRTQVSTKSSSEAKFEHPSPTQQLRDVKAGVPLKVEIVSVTKESRPSSPPPLRIELVSDGSNKIVESLLSGQATKAQMKLLELLLAGKISEKHNKIIETILGEETAEKQEESQAAAATPVFKAKAPDIQEKEEETKTPSFVPRPSTEGKKKSSAFTPAPPKIILKSREENLDEVPVEGSEESSLFEPTDKVKLSRKLITADMDKDKVAELDQTSESDKKSNKIPIKELVKMRNNGEEPPVAKSAPTSEFKRPKFIKPVVDTSDKTPVADDYLSPQILITEDPPAIHRLKNFFQQKAEKYFFFAMLTIFVDYLIDNYGDDYRPSKTFVFFCTFIIAGIIALGTWKYVTYEPPDNATNCRYNVRCTGKKCKFNGIHRFKDIHNQRCPKCSEPLGLVYRCRNCHKEFLVNEKAERNKARKQLYKTAKLKEKWQGKKIRIKSTMYNTRLVRKCPTCYSTDVFYVTVKMAEKEAAEKAKIKAQAKAAKAAEKILRKKRGGRKRKRKPKKTRKRRIQKR